MGPATLGTLIPILGILIGGFVVFSRSDIGHALAHRLGGGGDGQADLRNEVERLRADIETLRGELIQTQERLDFTERLLAGSRKEG